MKDFLSLVKNKNIDSATLLNKMSEVVITEAQFRRCSTKKVFLKILQNSQENTYARFSFSYRTPPVAASAIKGSFYTYVRGNKS